MITVTATPQKIVDSDNNVSKWNAVHHPIKFTMQRRDLDVAIEFPSDGVINIIISGLALTYLTVGDTFYWETNSGNSGTATIDTLHGSQATCTINTGSGTTDGFGFVNFDTRQNYFIKTKVLGVTGVTGNLSYYEVGTSINKPSLGGVVIVDVSTFLKLLVGYENNFDYDVVNWRDSSLAGYFNIQYSENWLGYEGAFSGINDSSELFYTNSAKQIQDVNGTNMGVYVPFTSNDNAKFLTGFTKPTFFKGFPFSLSFIYSDDIFDFAVNKKEQAKDNNGNNVGGVTTTALDYQEGVGIHRMMLQEGYGSTVSTLEVYLDNTSTPTELEYMVVGYVDAGYFGSGTTTVGTSNLATS